MTGQEAQKAVESQIMMNERALVGSRQPMMPRIFGVSQGPTKGGKSSMDATLDTKKRLGSDRSLRKAKKKPK